MADFVKGPSYRPPFGKNIFLRSTQDVKVRSATFAKAGIPSETLANGDVVKVLQPGTVLATITAVGDDQGKVGVFSAAATDGRQTLANIVGINQTFLPWQLQERDVEVGVIYDASVNQAQCIEYDASDDPIALTNTTRDGVPTLGTNFIWN